MTARLPFAPARSRIAAGPETPPNEAGPGSSRTPHRCSGRGLLRARQSLLGAGEERPERCVRAPSSDPASRATRDPGRCSSDMYIRTHLTYPMAVGFGALGCSDGHRRGGCRSAILVRNLWTTPVRGVNRPASTVDRCGPFHVRPLLLRTTLDRRSQHDPYSRPLHVARVTANTPLASATHAEDVACVAPTDCSPQSDPAPIKKMILN